MSRRSLSRRSAGAGFRVLVARPRMAHFLLDASGEKEVRDVDESRALGQESGASSPSVARRASWTGSNGAADAGADVVGQTTTPVEGGMSPATALAGIWSGNVHISHPDFAGPPIDWMTVEIGDDGRLRFSGVRRVWLRGLASVPRRTRYHSPGALSPTCSRATASCSALFTVQSADWQSDHLLFTYTAFSTGLSEGETPETPFIRPDDLADRNAPVRTASCASTGQRREPCTP